MKKLTEACWEERATEWASIRGLTLDLPLDISLGNKSVVYYTCLDHGRSKITLDKLNSGQGCRECGIEAARIKRALTEEARIKQFLSTNKYAEGTSFKRTTKPNKDGRRTTWEICCGKCKEVYEQHVANILKGHCGCSCKLNQNFTYVHRIYDEDTLVGFKLGLAKDVEFRRKRQQKVCIFNLKPWMIWEFNSTAAAKKAERACKISVPTGVVSKYEMPDGWSETFSSAYLEQVLQIFEEHGGIQFKTGAPQ